MPTKPPHFHFHSLAQEQNLLEGAIWPGFFPCPDSIKSLWLSLASPCARTWVSLGWMLWLNLTLLWSQQPPLGLCNYSETIVWQICEHYFWLLQKQVLAWIYNMFEVMCTYLFRHHKLPRAISISITGAFSQICTPVALIISFCTICTPKSRKHFTQLLH